MILLSCIEILPLQHLIPADFPGHLDTPWIVCEIVTFGKSSFNAKSLLVVKTGEEENTNIFFLSVNIFNLSVELSSHSQLIWFIPRSSNFPQERANYTTPPFYNPLMYTPFFTIPLYYSHIYNNPILHNPNFTTMQIYNPPFVQPPYLLHPIFTIPFLQPPSLQQPIYTTPPPSRIVGVSVIGQCQLLMKKVSDWLNFTLQEMTGASKNTINNRLVKRKVA